MFAGSLFKFYSSSSMHNRKESNLLSPPARDLRRLTLNSGDSSKLSLVKTKRARRIKRMKLQPVNYTCQTEIHFSVSGDHDQKESKKQLEVNGEREFHRDPVKITFNLSFSSEDNDGVVLQKEDGSEGLERGTSYGVVSVIGSRSEMEDTARAELGFAVKGSKRYDFFGVYDGHGGTHVASACRERLHEVVAVEIEKSAPDNDNNGKDELEWEKLMEGCFGKMDDELRGNAAARTVGATAVVAVVAEEEVVVANCGDCRAVLSRAGLPLALSADHKPERPDELERIEAAGGRVINWKGHRVLGVLATSRSIGDEYLRPFVISKPEVTITKRTDEDEFLILGSDGLWDVVSNEVACKVVKKCLDGQLKKRRFSKDLVLNNINNNINNNIGNHDHRNSASEAATVLAELAMVKGSRDNISVIVVDLRKT